MPPTPVENVLGRLNGVVRTSGGFAAKCPCRDDDDKPSLAVSEGEGGRAVVFCHAGRCDTAKICESIGLTVADLFPPRQNEKLTLVKTYNYHDENGELLFQKLRYVDGHGKKAFRQRKPDGSGGWTYKLGDVPKILYNLPAVIQAKANGEPIWVVEGEKDADTLTQLGICATTMPNGAGTWMPLNTESLAGAVVEIIADNDAPGMEHAKNVLAELLDAGCSAQIWRCPNHKDISDHISAGKKLDDLIPVDGGESLEIQEVVSTEVQKTPHDEAIESIIKLFERDDMRSDQKVLKAELLIARVASDRPIDKGRLVDWTSFIDETTSDKYEWVIPGLVERSERVIVVAAEGVGKTMLARQVAICVGAGIHPFTFQRIKPISTLTVDLENPERIIRRTSRSIFAAASALVDKKQIQAHLLIKPQGMDLLRLEDRAVLEEMIERTSPQMLIMGPLYKSFIDPGGRTSEAVAVEVARYLDTIRDVYGVALWLEHHAPLGTSMTSRELRPFGSAVWSRWPEFGVALQPDPTGLPYHYDVRHFRGARDERNWPVKIKRGKKFPFEVVEFSKAAL